MSGKIVLHEDHGTLTPPQVIGIKKLVAEAVSKEAPPQSNVASLE